MTLPHDQVTLTNIDFSRYGGATVTNRGQQATCLRRFQGTLFPQVGCAVIAMRLRDFDKYWYCHLWKSYGFQTWAAKTAL